ncbi:peroxiredoxin-like family protein [Thermodesulfobacteriota bacterium]
MELRSLQLELARIKELGANLVAVTPELPDKSMSAVEKNELTFEVLSDVGNRLAKEFRIVFTLPADLRPIYHAFGINLPESNGDDTYELPIPATYVIDGDRKIRKAFVETDYTLRLDPEDIIATLEAIGEK